MKTSLTRSRSAAEPRPPRRLAVAALALAAAVSTLTLSAPVATAEAAEESAITVKWAGGNANELQQYQPDHAALKDNGSGHYDDFKDLQISVSKTTELRTEAVEVTVSGLDGTSNPGGGGDFVQMFQCWGADPLAVDFKETCQFGSWDSASGFPKAQASVEAAGTLAFDRGTVPGSIPGTTAPVPFRSVTGSVSEPYNVETSPGIVEKQNGISAFYTPSISNEIPHGYLNASGSTTIPFEVQSAAAQPHLGCGDRSSQAGARCWLVVVPRGKHSGELAVGTSDCTKLATHPIPFGKKGGQSASPMSPSCSFWQDRLVVPLDFSDAYASCPVAAAERRIIGSELAVDAISSWQSTLCTGGNAATFNLTTSAGRVVRDQLLTGQASFALTNKPLTSATVNVENVELLADADLRYAPVINTGFSIGFIADTGTVKYDEIKLTPRLLAKTLTQSYKTQLPRFSLSYSPDPEATYINDGRPLTIAGDPEWIKLGNPALGKNEPFLVTSGPAGDDAIGALWSYIRSDADARAFLQGEADPWGMTINPNYLPTTNAKAFRGGLPYDLASDESVDMFPLADQTVIDFPGLTADVDSVAWVPQASSLSGTATRIFRADMQFVDTHDPMNTAVFVRAAPTLRGVGGSRIVLGPITTGDAARLSLSTASLQLPSASPVFDTRTPFLEELHFVSATPEALAKGVEALTVDPATGTAQMDFGGLATDAYPLAMTLSAAVNLNALELDAAARADYSHFLRYAAAGGQVPGDLRGQLPDGFVPLSSSQKAATLSLADTLVAAPTSDLVPASPPAVQVTTHVAPVTVVANTPNRANPVAASGTTTPTALAAGGPTVSSAEDTLDASPTASIVGSSALGGSLIAGVAGLLCSVFLLRRRSLG
ncbi:hypothetical protein B0I08_10597 [Glaciihabitans tibetensis]|uniref:Htaa protein n=1 Tax=Glaciihabitans tibetensis TaxID=1266600 RepID=A0A2T0VCM6_9MICO|nr:hypothetical protein [Glaciihabitans tibetensis]PRY67936.1 hypothetical protein B0I08_10597 [Glaciihabitans tibetensis]